MFCVKYNGWIIHCLEEKKELVELANKVADGQKFDIEKELKATKRNYVAKIKFKGKSYVLKSPRNEFRIPQRKLATILKKGEALSSLVNITKAREAGVTELVAPFLAMQKRKYGMIKESYIIYEYIEGKSAYLSEIPEIVKLAKKMHDKGFYHGDLNPSNFLVTEDGMRVIDTQAKKYMAGKYRVNYDMLTLEYDSDPDSERYKEFSKYYSYKKDIWYYLAFIMKRGKKTKLISNIKKFKKKLRENGWRI